jgi:hypothetical protein
LLEFAMSEPRSDTAPALPRWAVLLGSAALAFHLLALGALVLAAPSGPWPTSFGTGTAMEPPFARAVSGLTTPYYLLPLKMAHTYHFPTDRPGVPAATFEVRLRDAQGKPLQTLPFPDPRANFWVRHRQGLLAQGLTDDQPVEPQGGETIPAPGRPVATVAIWDLAEGGGLRLRSVPEHLVPRDRPVFRPSPWSLLLVRAYARHLCRAHGAASAEVIRISREPVAPTALFADAVPADFETLVSNFGEFAR